ncbi:type II secretion system major pseudopilin GspG [bacterium]|nr:type II secretion system major pseudopilin GspG [bacterium]
MNKKREFKSESGFTLVEIMVVVVILAVLAGLVLPRIMERPEEARRTKARMQIEQLEGALKLFKLDNGFYPSTEQGLVALVMQPTVGRIPKNWKEGGYLEKGIIPIDPWGNQFVYISPGIHNLEYDIESYGPDGEDGGENENKDIESWNIE